MGAHAERMERLAKLREAMSGLPVGTPVDGVGVVPVLDERTLVAIRDGLKRIDRGSK